MPLRLDSGSGSVTCEEEGRTLVWGKSCQDGKREVPSGAGMELVELMGLMELVVLVGLMELVSSPQLLLQRATRRSCTPSTSWKIAQDETV